jgi:hypothetical protein
MLQISDGRNTALNTEFPPAVAYTDTLRLWFPRMPTRVRRALWGRWRSSIELRTSRRFPGYCVILLNRPTEEILRELNALRLPHSITRCDIAFDWPALTQREADNYQKFLDRHVLVRYRRKGNRQIWAPSGAIAWKQYRKHHRPAKNFMIYADRPSKMDKRPCSHFEIRLMTGKACRRAGLKTIADLLALDPSKLFSQQLRLVTHPKARGSMPSFHDRYPRRILLDLRLSILQLPTMLDCST